MYVYQPTLSMGDSSNSSPEKREHLNKNSPIGNFLGLNHLWTGKNLPMTVRWAPKTRSKCCEITPLSRVFSPQKNSFTFGHVKKSMFFTPIYNYSPGRGPPCLALSAPWQIDSYNAHVKWHFPEASSAPTPQNKRGRIIFRPVHCQVCFHPIEEQQGVLIQKLRTFKLNFSVAIAGS